jgi:glutathione S-transferase
MRARLAVASAGIQCELREIVLRDKAAAFLTASPKGTVPVLLTKDGQVIDESFDIMCWALGQLDPEDLLKLGAQEAEALDLIVRADGSFKDALDHYKYASRYPEIDANAERAIACKFLAELEQRLSSNPWLFGDRPKLPDFAILPFVRQFANVDRGWFDAQPWPSLHNWLGGFLSSPRFLAIMTKYPKWEVGQMPTGFPNENQIQVG